MPAGLFEADTSFPNLTNKKTTDEKIKAIQDYLYMLLETLRWTLRNLSPENFNDEEMAPYIGGATVNEFMFEIANNEEIRDEFETIVADTIISNMLITNELYAEYGEIADLVVDELRTDYKRVARYNPPIGQSRSTAPLDYIHIHDEEIDFITETVKTIGGEPQIEQFHHGARYFWWYDAEHTQITSTHDTGDPVIVYQYNRLIKGTIHFETVNGTKIPTFVLGAGTGDPQDADIGKGFLRKNTSSLDMWLHGDQDNGIFIGQYTDLVGLRKPTTIDFSNWGDGTASGGFSETLEGDIVNSFTVDFDNGVPIRFTDAQGDITEVVWE